MSLVIFSQWRSAPEAQTEFRIELHKTGFSGTARQVNGQGEFLEHRYQSLNPREPQKTPLLDSTLTFYLRVESDADLSLLEDIFGSSPGVYKIKKYVNGNLDWTGEVDTDRVSYNRGAYPFPAQIIARDIAPQRGRNYPLTTGRVRIIQAIAECLPLGLPIRTYTSWKEGSLSATQDFLYHRYIARDALRVYARTGDEVDEEISKYEALEILARTFGLIIHQSGDAWRLIQITALGDPESVRRYRYDSTGAFVSSADVDLSIEDDRDSLYIIPQTSNIGAKSYKEVKTRFDHRTTVQGIQLPGTIELKDATTSQTFTQFFNTDGNQSINFATQVQAFFDENEPATDARFGIRLRALSRFWNDTTQQWQSGDITNFYDLVPVGVGDGLAQYELPIAFVTDSIPITTGNDIQLDFFIATVSAGTIDSDSTLFFNNTFQIVNPTVADGNNTAIDYRLTQTRDMPHRYDHGSVWYGDGPTSYAFSAISRDADGEVLTASGWGRTGETLNQDFFQVLTREVMDTQRFASRGLRANLWGGYSPLQILVDDGDAYLFIGGSQFGRQNIWQAQMVQINIQPDVNDTFEIIYRTTADGATGAQPPTSGGGGGGGISLTVGDNRYLRRTLNLSDVGNTAVALSNLGGLASASNLSDLGNVVTARTNLDVFSKGEVLDITDLLASELFSTDLAVQALFDSKADRFGDEEFNTVRLTPLATLPDAVKGRMFFDDDNDAVAYYDNDNNKVLVGQNVVLRIKNNQGASITKGQVVRICATGFAGDLVCTRLAQANTKTNSNVIGVVLTDSINNQAVGKIVEFGKIEGLNTNAFNVGDTLWLSPTTAGALTTTKPSYPDFAVRIGYVTRKSATEGSILVAPERDSDIFTPGRVLFANGDGRIAQDAGELTYNSTTSELKAKIASIKDKLAGQDAFTPGFTGSGLNLERDSGEWNLELDNMFIRGALFASEFIINQISALNGSEILSPGRGKIEEVVGSVGTETVTVSDPQGGNFASFATNDLLLIQQVRPNDNAIVKRIVRRVDSITNNEMSLLPASGGPTDVGTIEVGDLIVAFGNSTNAARRSSIFRSVIDANNPFTRVFTGVSSWADWLAASKVALAYGNLNGTYGYSTDVFGFAAGQNTGANITADPSNGLRIRNGTTVAAQLSGDVFKVGDSTDFIDFDTVAGELDIKTRKFNLESDGVQISNNIGSGQRGLKISEEISSVFYPTVKISDETSFDTNPVAVTSFASVGGTFPLTLNDSSIQYRPNSTPGLSVSAGKVYEFEIILENTGPTASVVVQINIQLYDGSNWVNFNILYPSVATFLTIRPTVFVPAGFTHVRIGSIINSGQPTATADTVSIDFREILSSVQLNTQGLRVNKNSEEFVEFSRSGFKTTLPINFNTGVLFEDGLKRLVWRKENGTEVILATAP